LNGWLTPYDIENKDASNIEAILANATAKWAIWA
jgi:hypothetical protein